MKKFWKVTAIALAAVSIGSVCALAACQGMEDIVPDSYGEWDGNYIYRANGKMKTTGEDYEKLVSSFEVDEKQYAVVDCLEYEFIGDEIYMLVVGEYGASEDGENAVTESETTETQTVETKNAFIKYDIRAKEQTLIFADAAFENSEGTGSNYYRVTEVAEITSEKVYFYGEWKSAELLDDESERWLNVTFAVDYNGNFLDERYEDDENFVEVKIPATDLQVFKEWNSERDAYVYYFRKNGESELKEILSYSASHLHQVDYLEQNGVRGLVLRKYHHSKNLKEYKTLSSLEFYDLDTCEKQGETVSVGSYFQSLYGKYYYLYDYKTIEYAETVFERKSADVHERQALRARFGRKRDKARRNS